MVRDEQDYQTYQALDPAKKMLARLQGVGEVLIASDQALLRDVAPDRPTEDARTETRDPQLSAFGEDGVAFVVQTPHRDDIVTLTSAGVGALAATLDISRDTLVRALNQIATGQDNP